MADTDLQRRRDDVAPVHGIADVTAGWLTTALAGVLGGGRAASVTTAPVGTGKVADTFRLTVDYDPPGSGPATLVAKVPSAHEVSRGAAKATRTYEVEASFYRELAPTVRVNAPRCYHAAYDPATDAYVILLDDMAPAEQGDQIAGCTAEQADAALVELAELHASRWGDPTLEAIPWLNRGAAGSGGGSGADAGGFLAMFVPPFLERYETMLDDDTVALVRRFPSFAGAYLSERERPWTVVHGDFRLDNLLFGRERVAVVDWQTVTVGPALADVAYFLGASLPSEVRRAEEERLVRGYHERMTAAGVDLSWDDCWSGYRRHAFSGLVMAIAASMLVRRDDHGDVMFTTMATRHSRHALDLDAESLLGVSS
ncbi:MAG TPA: phosphotransferase [Acidimicrobiales bacterium]|nr:phosphotransferase [Acidimicrobiales bacterium]